MNGNFRAGTRRRFSHVLLFLALVMLFGACRNPLTSWYLHKSENGGGGPVVIDPQSGPNLQKFTVKGPEISLAWDDEDVGSCLYTVYSRVHSETAWKVLETGLSNPSLVVSNSRLPYGDYDFAVCRVFTDGTESGLHTSLDPSANPSTGWYLEWTP